MGAAKALWKTNPAGETWEYMYFLDIQPFATAVPLNVIRKDLGYGAKWTPQGFQFVEASRQESLTTANGSVGAWIAKIAGIAPPPGGPPGGGTPAQLWKPFSAASHKAVKLSSTHNGPDPDTVSSGLNAHRAMCKKLAAAAKKKGLVAGEPKPPAPNYDLRWTVAGTTWIAEVKSLTEQNETHQLRLGLGQLLEFLYQHNTVDAAPTYAGALVVTAEPSDAAYWRAVCASYSVTLVVGPSDFGAVGL